jgi:hypothetical protein
MNSEVKQFLDEAAAQGRIRAMLDAVIVGLGKGLKRSAPDRRALWQQIADEATKCRDGIPMGTKARAPKQPKSCKPVTFLASVPDEPLLGKQ